MDSFLVEAHARFAEAPGEERVKQIEQRLVQDDRVLDEPPARVLTDADDVLLVMQFAISAAIEVKADSHARHVVKDAVAADGDSAAEVVLVSARRLGTSAELEAP